MHARNRLLSRSVEVRLAALSQLNGEIAADVYSARRALLEDKDGRVRAEAARFLECAQAVSPVLWLIDATYDELPSVREAAARSLGRVAGQVAHRGLLRLSRLALLDPVWWVRRTAALSLSQRGGASAVATLKAVLGDPFWRVRHAAIQALTLLWQALPAEREQILLVSPGMTDVAMGAQLELQARVEPDLAAYKAQAPLPTDQPLTNPDPAVTTARLRARPISELTAVELLPLLSDPHTQLRELAVDRLARLSNTTELEQVCQHMAIPGLPHALESAWALLERTGKRASALIGRILSDHESPVGAVGWACHSVQNHGGRRSSLRAALLHPHPLARLAVVRCLDELGEADVVLFERQLEDDDAEVRAAALQALVARVPESELGRQLPRLLGPDSRPLTRLALVQRASSTRDHGLLTRLAEDEHPLVRARALRALAQLGRLSDLSTLAQDPDPLVRQSVTPWLATEDLVRMLSADPDPLVQREVIRQVWRRRELIRGPERQAVIAAASSSDDPWLRARAVKLLSVDTDLPLLLTLMRDRNAGVRQAVAAQLDGCSEVGPLVRDLLTKADLDGSQRAAAHAELLKLALDDPEAMRLLRDSIRRDAMHPETRPIAEAIAVLTGEVVGRTASSAIGPSTVVPPEPMAATSPRRRLGMTDLWVSPLAISGAADLSPRTLTRAIAAGVNLFFWEPGYEALTRLVWSHRRQMHVVTGSYEADRASITADVERALRRLKTDCIDVFLLFWVRSAERLSDEARKTLTDLKAQGKIRAVGFSTHDRSLAERVVEAGGWDVLMTRHSAAHPSAEQSLFPRCKERGTGLLTFSATSYGRLLQPLPGRGPLPTRPTAADCYRYSLAQPGVTAVISAPRYPSELYENLAILADPELPESRRHELLQHGAAVHAMSRRFNSLVRKGHESPLHAPNESTTLSTQLAELLAEHPAPPSEPLAAVTARRHPQTAPERRS